MNVDWGMITTAIAVGAIGLLILGVERERSFNTRQISLVAALTALGAAGRAATGLGMLFLQPTMFLPMTIGYAMGGRIGFFVGAMTPLVSNFFMGQGPWTPWQMLCWGVLGASGALVRYLRPGVRPVALIIACCIWGYLYGAVMDIWQWATYTNPLTWQSYFLLWAAGFSFDSLRALGNLFFCSLLGAQTMKILGYYQKKLSVQYLERLD